MFVLYPNIVQNETIKKKYNRYNVVPSRYQTCRSTIILFVHID